MLFRPARAATLLTIQPDASARRRRRATTAVEFAVVGPIYLMVVLGIVELGRGLMVTMLLFNAARIGARTGTLEGTANSDIKSAVNGYLSSVGINDDSVVVDVNDNEKDASTSVPGDEITVVVSISADKVTWVPGVKLVGFLSNDSGRNMSLSGQFTLRRE
jgi:Flp pilus assembly protein TadG